MSGKAKKKNPKGPPSDKILVCRNPKAYKRFSIESKLEAGMVLAGSEVKSLRDRRANLEGAYASVDRGELFLHQMHIGEYDKATSYKHALKRPRKLLAHKREIQKLQGRLTTQGYTLVPLQVYFRKGYAKVELGLAKAKQIEDKRQELKQKQDLREARKAMKKGT